MAGTDPAPARLIEVMARSRHVSALAWISLAALPSACAAAAAPTEARPVTSAKATAKATATVPGEAAVWFLRPDQHLAGSSTRFTALVSRLACNSGVTGQVLAPRIRAGKSEVVVTFTVARKEPGAATCPTNKEVPYEVELPEPLRGRALVDGQCLPGGEAATTAFCDPTSVRRTSS